MNNNKMAVQPIRKLIISMGMPVILSMMMQAAYNIVDSIFVGGMKLNGEFALNALTLAFPVQMLMVATSIGTGVGVNALLSKNLGQRDYENASYTTGNALLLGAVISVIFLIFGIFGVDYFVSSQTSNPLIHSMSSRYLKICCCSSFGIIYFSIFEKLLQATGRTQLSTIAQISGAVTNIILDPIMIYGWFGFPQMGVDGAAWATVVGQVVSALIGLWFHFKFNTEIKNNFKYLRPSFNILKRIYSIGFPAIIAQALMSFMTYGLNIILGNINENAVTAYGLFYKIQQFIFFAAFGLRDVITPIISFNYGMGNKKRIREGIKYGISYTLIIMFSGLIILELLAAPVSSIFGLSGETQKMCISAIKIISFSFLFAGANIAFQGVFQALYGGLESLIISICRQFLFVIPIAYLMSIFAKSDINNLWLVWFTFIISEGLSSIIGFILLKRIVRRSIEVFDK